MQDDPTYGDDSYATETDELRLDDYVRTVPDFPEDGVMYRDISPMLEEPEALEASVERIAELLDGRDVDVVAGFDARGFIHGPLVAQYEDKPFAMIRKEGKLPADTAEASYSLEYGEDAVEMHRDAIDDGDSVALVDDLLATGGTMEAGTELVEELGGEVAYCATVIELEDLDGRERLEEQGYEVGSLIQYGEEA